LALPIAKNNTLLLLSLFFSCALFTNLAQWYVRGPLFGGLSGVVSALVGFYAVNQWFSPQGPFYIQWTFVAFYIGYLLLVASGWFGVYSNAAHFGGLTFGIMFGFLRLNFFKSYSNSH
jgi:GlpG protein